jgi:hypothetical protein
MKRVPRYEVDLELVREGLERQASLVNAGVEDPSNAAVGFPILLGAARSYVGYLAVLQPDSPEVCRGLRLGARVAAAIFSVATGSGEVEVDLGTSTLTVPTTARTDLADAADWRTGWWLAHIVRDRAAVERLAAVPIEILRRSSARFDECQYLLIDALQAFHCRTPDWSTKFRRAIDATDPGRFAMIDEDYVLNIIVPEMQMLFRLATRELTPFHDALEYALERHKKYWGHEERKRDPDGYLALGPLAIASLAHDAGLEVEVDSDFVPVHLIDGGCR